MSPSTNASSLHVVWFKRDLRTIDHEPLACAAQHRDVLPLYVVEPRLIAEPDFSSLHWTFIRASLIELDDRLRLLGQPLIVRIGEVVDVLNEIRAIRPIAHLWAHQEIGTLITYQRDIRVRSWAMEHGIPVTELPQTGVIRGLKERGNSWAKRWEQRMSKPTVPEPVTLAPIAEFAASPVPTHADLGLPPDTTDAQAAGQKAAHETLQSFLQERGKCYHKEMSSPITAVDSCSRISPHLAWGTISLRTAVHALRTRTAEIKALSPEACKALDGNWPRALSAYNGRLHWHCHFMQRLETEPRIEFEALVPQLDEARADTWNEEWYIRWCEGQTGYPMVDACMRSLVATGWVNFRMRAMLNSFAAYHLMLDWRRYHHFLARVWVDYEPGIHISQCQMQSGVTGMNTLRIYSPTKQGADHDPEGIFIRRWVPELREVPDKYIHQPERMPSEVEQEAGCIIGTHYPEPVVDHRTAVKAARNAVNTVKYREDTQETIKFMYQKHGSRKSPAKKRKPKSKKEEKTQ